MSEEAKPPPKNRRRPETTFDTGATLDRPEQEDRVNRKDVEPRDLHRVKVGGGYWIRRDRRVNRD